MAKTATKTLTKKPAPKAKAKPVAAPRRKAPKATVMPSKAAAEEAFAKTTRRPRTRKPPAPQHEPEVAAISLTARAEHTEPQGMFSIFLEQSFDSLEEATAWAKDAARKLRTTVLVRNSAGGIVASASPPKHGGARTETRNRHTTDSMVEAMTTPGGATAREIQLAGGWRNKPALVHMDRWADARGFKVKIHSTGGQKRYEAVWTSK